MKKITFIVALLACSVFAAMADDNTNVAADSLQAATDTVATAVAVKTPYCKYKTATDGQANAMAFLMKREQFDEGRLKLGRKYIKYYTLTTAQLERLVETFTYNDFKLKFLKKAEKHCSDPENYTALVARYYAQ
ncbi:MAG: DUF4476 domain-containing protein [Paludibacteraceae bacterium]